MVILNGLIVPLCASPTASITLALLLLHLFLMLAFDVCKVVKILAHHLGYQHNSRKVFCLIFSYKLAVSKNRDPVTYTAPRNV